MIFNMVGGGGGSGATLVVSSPANVSVTVSKDDKSYTKNSGSLGSATFKGLSTGTWAVTISGNGQTATKTIEITADYAIIIAFFSASINITYPANSTCIVTNAGGQTVASDTNTGTSAKTWTATVNATGTYTITATATDGSGKTKSATVSITAEGQVETVTLSYEFVLFDSGSLASGYSLDTYAISPAIDVTKYSVMSIIGKITWMNYNLTYYVGLSPTLDGEWAAQAGFSSTTETTVDVDISSLSGLYYFSADNNVTLSITNGILKLTTSNYTGVISQIKFS